MPSPVSFLWQHNSVKMNHHVLKIRSQMTETTVLFHIQCVLKLLEH